MVIVKKVRPLLKTFFLYEYVAFSNGTEKAMLRYVPFLWRLTNFFPFLSSNQTCLFNRSIRSSELGVSIRQLCRVLCYVVQTFAKSCHSCAFCLAAGGRKWFYQILFHCRPFVPRHLFQERQICGISLQILLKACPACRSGDVARLLPSRIFPFGKVKALVECAQPF
jgi:hypothetical protein